MRATPTGVVSVYVQWGGDLDPGLLGMTEVYEETAATALPSLLRAIADEYEGAEGGEAHGTPNG